MDSKVFRRIARVAAPASAAAVVLLGGVPAGAAQQERGQQEAAQQVRAQQHQHCSDQCRLDAAHSYIRALVTHRSADVPLSPEATRVEAGVQTGFSGPQIRADLAHGPQYRVIRGVRDEHDHVVNGTVHTNYLLDVGLGPVGLTTARVSETFTFDGRGIRTITAHISVVPGVPGGR